MRISKHMIINHKHKPDKGFTLVELLAVIAVLSLVIGLVIFISINVINNAKEKSYKTTINNIEEDASNYLIENSGRLFYLGSSDNTYEYQCITIQNLIDTDYFDENLLNSKIANDRYVSKEDYIYIERDIKTKSIQKKVLIVDKPEYTNICGIAVNAIGDIRYNVEPSLDSWSKEKEVTVYYSLKNLNDYNKLEDYTYNWSESNDTSNTEKKVIINSNKKITANIKNKDEIIISKDLEINKIDVLGPIVSLGSNVSGYFKESITIPLKVTDDGIGPDYNSFTKDDIEVTVGDKIISDTTLGNCNTNGICNLVINDNSNNGDVVIKIKDASVTDKLGNKNKEQILNTDIIFDNESPVITLGTDGNNSYQKSVSSKINVTDNVSGGDIDTYKYIYSTSNSATPNISFSSGSSYSKNGVTGKYYLIVKACDRAGNCTTKTSNEFKLDDVAPTCKLKVTTSGIFFENKNDNISVTTYGLGDTTTITYNNNQSLPIGKGTFYGYVKDEAGNESVCSATVDDTKITKYDKVTQTCGRSISSYNKTTKKCNANFDNYTITSKYCGRIFSSYKCKGNATSSTSTSKFSCEGYGCCSKSGYSCSHYYSGVAASGMVVYSCVCTKTTYSCSHGYRNGTSCYTTVKSCPSGYSIVDTNYTYSFGSAKPTTSTSCSSNLISCNSNTYGQTYRSCSANYTYSFGDSTTTTVSSCSSNTFSCSASTSGLTYTSCSTNYSYGFKSSTSSVNSCTTTSSKKCASASDYSNDNSYVSKCTPTEYSCDNGYTKINDSYCYKINN